MSGNTRRHILLTGMMGSGKSTIGQRLADVLKWPFFDLDEEIEKRYAMTIGQIFGQYGEEIFRQWEEETLERMLAHDVAIVLALGGGALLREKSHSLVKPHHVIWLDAPSSELWRRVKDTDRPLVAQGQEAFFLMHQARQVVYEKVASLKIECVGDPSTVVAAIFQGLGADIGGQGNCD
ncbi:shikimate kinase [Sulfobacillus thermosulfidooxidans]|uniref:shikimate kinase n=1 Tax=Sulfobacillus thermosulfidooxidans TaxID=28034 RepID=UPI0006B5B7F3|nr:shikimate kinase [Sulfobacillus thermosulfidooxidans]